MTTMLPRDPDHALHAAVTALVAGCRPQTKRRQPERAAAPRAIAHRSAQAPATGDERALPDAALLRWYAAGRLGAPAR